MKKNYITILLLFLFITTNIIFTQDIDIDYDIDDIDYTPTISNGNSKNNLKPLGSLEPFQIICIIIVAIILAVVVYVQCVHSNPQHKQRDIIIKQYRYEQLNDQENYQPNHNNYETLFPENVSHYFTGYYSGTSNVNKGQNNMDIRLIFNSVYINGDGIDNIGTFTVKGTYKPGELDFHFIKRYDKRNHDVHYIGSRFVDSQKGLYGYWIINSFDYYDTGRFYLSLF